MAPTAMATHAHSGMSGCSAGGGVEAAGCGVEGNGAGCMLKAADQSTGMSCPSNSGALTIKPTLTVKLRAADHGLAAICRVADLAERILQ